MYPFLIVHISGKCLKDINVPILGRRHLRWHALGKKEKEGKLSDCVLGSLAFSCSSLRWPSPTPTDHRCLSARLLFMATDTFLQVNSWKFLQRKHSVSWVYFSCLDMVETKHQQFNQWQACEWTALDLMMQVVSHLSEDLQTCHMSISATGQSSHWASGQQFWGRWGI